MKRKRHNPQEITRILRMADGEWTVEEVCLEVNISEQTFYRWRRQYGSIEPKDVRKFKELGIENAKLKKLLVEKYLRNEVLKEVLIKSNELISKESGRRKDY